MAERGASRDRRTGAPSRRGSSFVEVLLAMTILALVLVGILQMFSLSLLTDFGSAGRTEMTFKAQQVVEILRWVSFLRRSDPLKLNPADPGNPPAPADKLVVNLPWVATDPYWAFWGPAGANAVEGEKLPYQLSYSYAEVTGTTPAWIITVTATPKPVATGSVPTRLYLGSGSRNKRIDYVAQIPQ
jgi:hypothetical protein